MGDLPIPSPQNVKDFQDLYRRKYGILLEWEEACKALTSLMQLFFAMDQLSAPSVNTTGRVANGDNDAQIAQAQI
jgi:hypothetical protein